LFGKRVEVGLHSARLDMDRIPQVFRHFFLDIRGCSWTVLHLKLALCANLIASYNLCGTNKVT